MSDGVTTAIPSKAEMRDVLAAIYDRSEGRLGAQKRFVSVYRPYYSPVEALLRQIVPGSRVLEIGCGTGPMLFLLERFRDLKEGLGLDINELAIEIARTCNRSTALEFDTRNTYDLGAVDVERFDVLLCFDIIHHLPISEKPRFLRHMAQILRPGAKLIVKDLDARPRRKALANNITDWLSTRSRVSYWRRPQLAAFLAETGLEVTTAEDLHGPVWSHYLVAARRTP